MTDKKRQPCLWTEVCGCRCEDCEIYTPEDETDDIDDYIEQERISFRREYNKYIMDRTEDK